IIPERYQIGIAATARLAALTRSIDGDRTVPVTGVQDLSIARAVLLFPRCPLVEVGGIHRVLVARPRQRPEVEQGTRRGLLIEGVAEADRVELAPGPLQRVGTKTLLELLARRPEGIEQECVASGDRSLSEQIPVGIGKPRDDCT